MTQTETPHAKAAEVAKKTLRPLRSSCEASLRETAEADLETVWVAFDYLARKIPSETHQRQLALVSRELEHRAAAARAYDLEVERIVAAAVLQHTPGDTAARERLARATRELARRCPLKLCST